MNRRTAPFPRWLSIKLTKYIPTHISSQKREKEEDGKAETKTVFDPVGRVGELRS